MKRLQMFTLFGGCRLLVSNQEGVNIPQCQLLHINKAQPQLAATQHGALCPTIRQCGLRGSRHRKTGTEVSREKVRQQSDKHSCSPRLEG